MAAAASSLAVTALIFAFAPPAYVSYGNLWETEKLKLPDGAFFADGQKDVSDRANYLGTQAELLRSKTLGNLTLNRMEAVAKNNDDLYNDVKDKDCNWIPVGIQVYSSSKSSIYTVEARSANPAFTVEFLNALMLQYLEYRKNFRREVSSDTLTSTAEQVQRIERDMQVAKAALNEYERSNNLPVLRVQSAMAVECLANLNNQLSALQLEDVPLNQPGLSKAESVQHQTLQLKIEYVRNAIKEWEAKVVDASAKTATAEELRQNALRNQGLYERLATLLQNVDFTRNTDQGTVSVLQDATAATRSFAYEQHILTIVGFSGLGLGLAIDALLACYRASRRNAAKADGTGHAR